MSDDLEDRTRQALRRARLAADLAIGTVARRAGMSESTLSRIETGGRRLTLGSLERICDALGTSTEAILRAAARDGLRVPTPMVVLGQGMRGVLLGHEPDGAALMRLLVPVTAGQDPAALATHPGHDWVHVLRGRLCLELGEEVHVLGPGETVHFDTTRPHGFSAAAGPCEILCRFSHGGHAGPGGQDPRATAGLPPWAVTGGDGHPDQGAG